MSSSKLSGLLRLCLGLAAVVVGVSAPAAERPRVTTIIVNAQIADGTGAALRKANVRIEGDRIVKAGDFKPAAGERVIDAKGLVLAPGFIDMHNHSDEGLEKEPLATSQIAQGITTMILGPDGSSPWPVGDWLAQRRRSPASLNLALTVGHSTVRQQVMKEDYERTATAAEVAAMTKLVEQAMSEGAIGVSSGVEYEVPSYSETNELVEVAKAAAKHGGFYMTHIRDEADKSFAALEEEVAIGERAHIPVQHSHIKLGTVNTWGKAREYIGIIEAARRRGVDFLADAYPYDAWNSTIKVLVPDKQYQNPKSVERALADVGGASHVTITDFPPNRSYEMKTLQQLADGAGISPVEMFIRVIREGEAGGEDAGVVCKAMTEADIKAFYQQPWVMVASDGGIGSSHPRGAGTFPRVLGRYVREKHWLTLPEAVRKMTSLPAQRLGWKDRGTIREGAFADLVLFDPETVIDRATFAQPHLLPTGIEKVFVNGELVWSEGRATGARPGRVLP